MKTCAAIAFDLLRDCSDVAKIYQSLDVLRPDKMSSDQLLQIVLGIEEEFSTSRNRHYNIFGTGGDRNKTINISTIAALVAAKHFVPVVKVGTDHITSCWGSSEFIEGLKKSDDSRIKRYMGENSQFEYVSLHSLGVKYSDSLREARQAIYDDGLLDIFKVVFPVSNLTHSQGQVNGISDIRYLSYFVDILKKMERNAIIVHSETGVDEIFSGDNLIIEIRGNEVKEKYVRTTPSNPEYTKFIAESSVLEDHVQKFAMILQQECCDSVLETIYMNVASIVKLSRPNDDIFDIYEHVSDIMLDLPIDQ